MEGILNDLEDARKANSLADSIRVIWFYAHQWGFEEDEKEEPQKVAVQIYDHFSESFAIPIDYLEHVVKSYHYALKLFCKKGIDESRNEFENLSKEILETELPSIKKRVVEYRTSYGPVFVARSTHNEYFIAANGELRRNFPYFDAWYENERDFLINYYEKSIKKVFGDDPGYLVFIQKRFGPHGPILLKNYLADEIFPKFGVITIKGKKPEFERDSDNKDFCILYDLILTGEGIKEYVPLILKHDLDFRLKANIILYNEKPESDDFILKKTLSLVNSKQYQELLISAPMYYTPVKRKPTALEDLMFGIGSSLAFGDKEIGAKLEDYSKRLLGKVKIRQHAH